jgi:hypothetical protein
MEDRDRAEWNYLLIQTPGWLINNYNIKLSMSGLNEIDYLSNLTDTLNSKIVELNLDIDYDKFSLLGVFNELIAFTDELSEYLHGYRLTTSIDFLLQDPELIYTECNKLADEFLDKNYPTEVENNGFRLKKLTWLYGLLLKLQFLQGRLDALNPPKKDEVYSLPYKIALLHEIGFFDLPKLLAVDIGKREKIIKSLIGGNERDIRGNIAVLKPQSKDSRLKYTSNDHLEDVAKLFKNR